MVPRVLTVTVSDTRTANDDRSGKALVEELAAFTHVRHVIVPDEPERIVALLREVMESDEADAVVLSGGTGIAPRDRTYEALEALFDKRLDGFGEAFRRLSWEEIGPRAILSRATAGTVGTRLVFSLPGSEKAARLGARELIAPVLAHAVELLHGRTAHGPHGPAGAHGGKTGA
jgi:molybdenum cofactor biosynthesis protein B